jgi:type IV secretion system protein VirB9
VEGDRPRSSGLFISVWQAPQHATGIHSNLNLITDIGNIYSFTLDDVENAEPDLKVVIEPRDASVLTAANGATKLVPASEVAAAQEQTKMVQAQAARRIEQFRSEYPTKELKFDYVFHDEKPFDVSAIYHDEQFTYIQSSATEKFAIYEVKDSKPDLISFQLTNGTYVIPQVVDRGYLEIGKRRLPFERHRQ